MLNFAVHYETLKRRRPEASSSSFDGPESYEGAKRRYQVSPKSEAKKRETTTNEKVQTQPICLIKNCCATP